MRTTLLVTLVAVYLFGCKSKIERPNVELREAGTQLQDAGAKLQRAATSLQQPDIKSEWYVPRGVLSLVAAISSGLGMLGGLALVFHRLHKTNKGFGPNSLKALGLVLFLPTLAMVAVTVEKFETQTLAALLGTVAGYVLSQSRGETEQ